MKSKTYKKQKKLIDIYDECAILDENVDEFLFVVSKTISKSFGLFLIILNVVFPIEPVEPNIAIFFFIITWV